MTNARASWNVICTQSVYLYNCPLFEATRVEYLLSDEKTHDWWVTDRIFPPSPLDPGIPFLNHLTVYSILQCSARNHPEGIPVVAQLLEKVVYVDMKALEEEAAVSC